MSERDADLEEIRKWYGRSKIHPHVEELIGLVAQARDERDAAKADAAKWRRRFDLEFDRHGETMKTLRDEDTDRLRDRFMRASTPGERFILLLDALEDTRDALARLVHAERDRDASRAEIARLHDALESIWGQWAAGNASVERAMEAVRELIYGDIREDASAPPAPTLTLTAEEAWERDADAVGRAAHEAWKRWIVQGGYADHPLEPLDGRKVEFFTDGTWRHACGFSTMKHHEDMVPYDDLPEEKRSKYLELGKAGYLLGFAAHTKLAAGERM